MGLPAFPSAQPTAFAFALEAVTLWAKTGEAWLSAKHDRTARSATLSVWVYYLVLS
jgi:hypothetical protein